MSDLALDIATIRASGLFDEVWYLAEYPDVGLAGLDAIEHFTRYGAQLGRSPGPSFDTRYYSTTNPDVETLGLNPLLHFIRNGQAEGRLPHAPAALPDLAIMAALSEQLAPSGARLLGALDLSANEPVAQGWLAELGASTAREAVVLFDGIEVGIMAADYREDLHESGINQGEHGFRLHLPPSVLDGRTREFVLTDGETGAEIARASCAWGRTRPPYSDFEGFLKFSMTSPVFSVPFQEEHKRSFAMMEGVANRLVARADALTKPPLISVIMPVYDREATVERAIYSVLAQGYARFELIIVDDGSQDASVKTMRRIIDPRINLIELPENQGQSAARNAGQAAAKGDIIAYLDSDNSWDPRYLAALAGAFDQNPNADALYSGQTLYRGTMPTPFAVRYSHYHRAMLENQNYADLNTFAHRRKLLAPVGGFATELRRFVDHDFILRCAEAGRMISVPVLLCNYMLDQADNTVSNDTSLLRNAGLVSARLETRTAARLAAMPTKLSRPVAAVIPSFEALDDLQACIAALRASAGPGDLEIIVADNASAQPVVDWLRSQTEITLIENTRNFGFTYAVNQGIAAARPDADILIINNDAVLRTGALCALQEAAYALPDAAMTVPRQILPPGTPTVRSHVPAAREARPADVTLSAHHQNIAHVKLVHDGGPLELTYAPFFAVYLRRDAVDEAGPLDVQYGRHYRSDRLYCDVIRMVLGRKIYYIPDAYADHKLQQSTHLLRATNKGSPDADYDLMFRRNQWDRETAEEWGFRPAPWDLF